MLIPKLLFQGKVDNGKEGLDFESYSFDFDASDSSITITLGTAKSADYHSRRKKLAEMTEKIKNELNGEPFLLSNSAVAVMQAESNVFLKIDRQTALLLAEKMAKSGNEDIALGAVWINIVMLGLYSDDLDFKKEYLLKIINNQLFGYINYIIDNTVSMRSDMRHVFYIGDNFKTNSTIYKIHASLAQKLREELIETIIELLDFVPLSEIKECQYGKGDSHAVAFVLSHAQFLKLESNLKTKRNVTIVKQEGVQANASVISPAPQELSIFEKTKKYLYENVFPQGPDEIPQYQTKSDLLICVETKFLEIHDIDVLVSLYDFINESQNKKKLNIHRNFGDSILLNFDTKGWQDLVAEIRAHALNVLFEKYNLQEFFSAKETGQKINVIDPAMVAEHLSLYSKTKLFSQHRSNMNFFNLFHSTQAVEKIKKVTIACECQINKQSIEVKI